jgi:small ligand-binding sensory domain FIST
MQIASALATDGEPRHAAEHLAKTVVSALGSGPIDLACLFLSTHFSDGLEEIVDTLHERLRIQTLIGCTGEGVIADAEELEGEPAVVLWAGRWPGADVRPVRLAARPSGDTVLSEQWPATDLVGQTRRAFILLADPFTTPMDDVFGLVQNDYPGSPIVGGLAGGGRGEGENRMILNREVYDQGVVGVSIAGSVALRSVVSQGCRPIGDRFVVTRGEQNIIHELSGAPAIEQLQKVFEVIPAEDRDLAQRALHIGLAMDEQRDRFERGDFLVRNIIGGDRASGSLAIGDLVTEGRTVQFHVRDARTAREDLRLLLSAERARTPAAPAGALLFSCCGRGRQFFGLPHHDAAVLRERVGAIPVAGFFAQGEIGPVGPINYLHGYTASVALFGA